MDKGHYSDNGINLSKYSPKVGDKVSLSYDGLLKRSGARNLKVHIGYNDTWEDSEYIEMNPSGEVFMATIPIKKEGMLNFAFTDPVGNWDNNSGFNYGIPVAKTTKTAALKTGPSNKKTAIKAEAPVEAAPAAVDTIKKRGRPPKAEPAKNAAPLETDNPVPAIANKAKGADADKAVKAAPIKGTGEGRAKIKGIKQTAPATKKSGKSSTKQS